MRKLFIVQLVGILIFSLSLSNICSAAVLFQDDAFNDVESDAIRLGSNDNGAVNTAIRFGNDAIAAENGNLTWNIASNKFNFDHDIDIAGGLSASGNVTTSGNISTTGSGTISSASTLSGASLILTTPLALAYGGTNNSITADNGGIVFSDASKLTLLSSTATSGKVLQSGANSAPSWSTPTYPSASGTAGKILRSDGTNNVYSTATFPDTAGAAGNILQSDGTNFISTSAAATTTQSTPANPSSTTNSTGVMMGMAGSITPSRSGKILIIISGDLSNTTSGDGAKAQIRYGTGTAPSNGAALTGTAAGSLPEMTCSGLLSGLVTLTGCTSPFSTNAVVSGLSTGTAYWIDSSLAAVGGGTATMQHVSISAIEL